jgi:glycosyltransferase involved in cell wall biosynthesis
MHIALNAHLLSSQAGYRAAGIHGYIDGLLRHLKANAPSAWRFTAMVGKAYTTSYPGLTMQRAPFDTESPPRRILWEQLLQPFALRGCDLHHALAFVAPLAINRPFVVTIYDLSFIHYPERLSRSRRLYLRMLTGLTCRRAERVIAISHSTAQDLTATLNIPAEKIDIAAPGYDNALFRPLPEDEVSRFRRTMNLPERFWLFVGTLEPRKNLVTLLEAYAALPPASRLPLIIGGGKGWDYQAIFDTVARHNLTSTVQFVGFIPSAQLRFWYNSAEAFLYPSVFEGFGLPVLEAMACGTPVLVSDASSLPEVAGMAGRTLPPHDVSVWTEALRAAEGDDTWRREAREQGFREASRYSWDETARQTVLSYERALA